jgi:NAD-dependent dihydropyrimidine dehydrogenase PreA subunit
MTMDIPLMTMEKVEENAVNTLSFRPSKCINCGRCSEVCPHGVFVPGEKKARMAAPDRCMECGACMVNCPTRAIAVESGVGCAAAMIKAALTGSKEVTCGPDCCGR